MKATSGDGYDVVRVDPSGDELVTSVHTAYMYANRRRRDGCLRSSDLQALTAFADLRLAQRAALSPHYLWRTGHLSDVARLRRRAGLSAAGLCWYAGKKGELHVRVYGGRFLVSCGEAPLPFNYDGYGGLHPFELVYPFVRLPGHYHERDYHADQSLVLALIDAVREDPFDEASWAAACDVMQDAGCDLRAQFLREQMRRAMFVRHHFRAALGLAEGSGRRVVLNVKSTIKQLETT